MSKHNPIVRILGLLLVLALLAGGAFAAYRFGYAQGLTDSPQMAETMQKWQESGTVAAPFFAPGMRGFHPMGGFYPMRGGHHFSFGGILGFLFVAFLFFGAMRMIFRPHWAHHMHGPWHGYPPPPWAQQQPQPGQAPQAPTDAPKE